MPAENNKQPQITIFGSCVTRDVFDFTDHKENLIREGKKPNSILEGLEKR
jgi:hypothetical protein